ncbi:MAG TPA: hypothetical protein VFY48_04350 [Solirubrobacterales bacterium]|nr:hypothetical protein [Solirubrobacterales bacterium]
MELMRESWTDERLDDLNDRVSEGFRQNDERFGRVEGEIRDLRAEMNARFERVDSRLDSIQRTLAIGAITLTGGMLAGFAAITALIATQI